MPRGRRTHFHAPKFEDHERSTPEADAFLPIENGAWRRNLNHRDNEQHERQPNWERQRYQREIQSSLPARHLHQELTG